MKTKHGYRPSGVWNPTYSAWQGMKSRCYNRACKQFHDYGGRGILVCDRWKNSFIEFLHDMGEKPHRLTLDRINNNGNYEPGNCRWADYKTQEQNRRDNNNLMFRGRVQCLSEWSRELSISRATIWKRMSIMGWSVEKTFTTPIDKVKSH